MLVGSGKGGPPVLPTACAVSLTAMARNSGDMSLLSYENDPRPKCKYGAKCYQKNQVHIKSFKHPPNLKRELQDVARGDAKKQKREQDSDSSSEEENVKEDISDYSDSEPDIQPSKNVAVTSMQIDQEANGSKKEKISDNSDSEMSVTSNSPETVKKDQKKMSPVKKPVAKEHNFSPRRPTAGSSNDNALCKLKIKEKFLLDMPEDFFEFWNFCKSLNEFRPAEALKAIGLMLVGPYDEIAGNLNEELPSGSNFLIHWRYYYDPPEFQTVLKGDDKTLFHIGYFRDDPKEDPCFLASNAAAKGCTLTPIGDNIFSAVNSYLISSMKTVTPFLKMKYVSIQKSLQEWAKNTNFSLNSMTPSMKSRQNKIVSKSFHGAGIVVPVNKKTQLGYRELLETDARLKKILKLIVDSESEKEVVRDLCFSKLDPIITAANIANDECDFGTSLELGIDLFCFGGKILEAPALALLTTAYSLLRRPEFSQIIKAHLANRRQGFMLSVV